MPRLKRIGALALCAALFAYAAYGLARFLITGQAYARHFGMTTFADHPAGVAMSVTVYVVVLVGGTLYAGFTLFHRRRD